MASETPVTARSQMELWHDLMQFYIREAWMLDERRFREWLDLFTEDVLYFMPRRLNVHRHETERELTSLGDLAIFEDDKTYMRMRVDRLETGMAWGEDPPSRTRHIVGNLVVAPQPGGEVMAKTAFILYRSHHETEENVFAGYRDDLLRRVDGEWKIAQRTIVLDANVIMAKNLSVFF